MIVYQKAGLPICRNWFRTLLPQAALFFLVGLLDPQFGMAEGTWTAVSAVSPKQIGSALLLSDGTVMETAHDPGITTNLWYRLTPDRFGHYVNGTWSTNTIAPMKHPRAAYASQVLENGWVFVAGGEYSSNPSDGVPDSTDDATAEVYDPVVNTWTEVDPPVWLLNPNGTSPCLPPALQRFSDMISEVLPNGNVLMAPVFPMNSGDTLTFNVNQPLGSEWSLGGTLINGCDMWEASWVKLADGSILAIDSEAQTSERYLLSANNGRGAWIADANVPVAVFDPYLNFSINTNHYGEEGAAFLLPNSNAFFIGSIANTAIYIPSPLGGAHQGTWVAGPSMTFTNVMGPATFTDCNGNPTNTPNPLSLGAPDAPAAMMVNGKVLCALSQAPNNGNPCKLSPTYFFEYDYSKTSAANPYGTFTQIHASGGGYTYSGTTDGSLMLDLPDGTVFYAGNGQPQYGYNQGWIYQPDGSPLAAGKPAIASITVNDDGSYHLTGAGLNGISDGAAFGDDSQMATDYPLVRLTESRSGNVFYARTYNWSNAGLMTGNKIETTEFSLPSSAPNDGYWLAVVANGSASDPVYLVKHPPIHIGSSGTLHKLCVLTWSNSVDFQLQTTSDLSQPWSNIVGATSPYSNNIASAQQFFRLAGAFYFGNSLTVSNGGSDGSPPLVILGEYSSAGPLPAASLLDTLPTGTVQDVKFYGRNYDFTLYALSLVTNGPNAGEQTFQVAAAQHFSGDAAFAGMQTLPVQGFSVVDGELLAFAGTGPYYAQNDNDAFQSDATYEDSSAPASYTATPPGGAGSQFAVGLYPDPQADYEFIPNYFGNQGRTYAIGVDVLAF